MSKKNRVEETVVIPAAPDASVKEKEAIAQKWACTAEEPLQAMAEVQDTIQMLTEDLEKAQREVTDIEGEFLQLLQSRPNPDAPHSSSTRKGRAAKRDTDGTTTGGAGGGTDHGGAGNTLRQAEAAIRSIEEKKWARISHALIGLFRYHCHPGVRGFRYGGGKASAAGTASSSVAGPHGKSSSTPARGTTVSEEGTDTSHGMTMVLPVDGPQSAPLVSVVTAYPFSPHEDNNITVAAPPTPGGSPGGVVGGSETIDDLPRRPKDCPVVLWDEVLSFRLRRLMAEERVHSLCEDVERQMKRFSILQSMYELCIYSTSAAKTNYIKAFTDWQARVRKGVPLTPSKT